MKVSKNRKLALDALDLEKVYEPIDAIKVLKEKTFVKFDETLDISINLNIDASKTEQNIKGVTNLPNGTGKKVRVAVITSDDNVTEAKESGADLYGGQEFIDNISSNKIDFDILIATPDIMPKLGKVAKTLGPKGLMPNPKLGTVTKEIKDAVTSAKSGQVKFKNDKSGIVHAGIGKISFSDEKILENLKVFYSSINKSKPDSVKGSFIKKVTIASTMGVGLQINQASLR
jgi:large subunit ribosomal protein L1